MRTKLFFRNSTLFFHITWMKKTARDVQLGGGCFWMTSSAMLEVGGRLLDVL